MPRQWVVKRKELKYTYIAHENVEWNSERQNKENKKNDNLKKKEREYIKKSLYKLDLKLLMRGNIPQSKIATLQFTLSNVCIIVISITTNLPYVDSLKGKKKITWKIFVNIV